MAAFSQHLDGDTIVEDLDGVQQYAGNMIDTPSYRYAGGAATLTDALAAGLPAGTLRLDHPVERISLVTARGRTWRARHVVLAVPLRSPSRPSNSPPSCPPS